MKRMFAGLPPTTPLWIAALGLLYLAALSLGLSVATDQLVNGPALDSVLDAGAVVDAKGASGWVTFTPDTLESNPLRILWGLSMAATYALLAGAVFLLVSIVETGQMFSKVNALRMRAGATIFGIGLIVNYFLQGILASRIGSEFGLTVSTSSSFPEPWMVLLLTVAAAVALWERGAALQELADATI